MGYKNVYVSHPLLGDMDRKSPNISVPFANKEKVDGICPQIVETYPNVIPLSPLHNFSYLNVFERETSLKLCLRLLSLCDEMWVFGDWENSEGCKLEIVRAGEMKIPVFYGKEGISDGA